MDVPEPTHLLRQVVDDLVAEFPTLEAAILFGSWARRAAGPESDIDLLVVGDFGQEDDCEVSHRPVDGTTVEITMMARQTLLRDLERGHPFALSVVRDGAVLYDTGVVAHLRRAAAAGPGRDFVLSYLRLARDRLAQGDLRAAATSIINVRKLLRNDVSISCHLESLLRGEPAPDRETVSRWIHEAEETVGSADTA